MEQKMVIALIISAHLDVPLSAVLTHETDMMCEVRHKLCAERAMFHKDSLPAVITLARAGTLV